MERDLTTLRYQAARMTAKQLQKLRIHTLHLTQEALAKQVGVTTTTVARWEQGVHPIAPAMAKLLTLIAKQKGG